jgi:hypothetical protein
MSYPQGGPCLEYFYDSSGRPTGLMSGSDVLVKDVSYDPVTERIVTYKQLDPGTGMYLDHRQTFNSKLKPERITDGFEQDPDPIIDIKYEYDAIDRLAKEEDRITDDVTVYKYDASGRLIQAEGLGSDEWGVEYEYDGFDNRLIQRKTAGAAPEMELAHDPETNHVMSNGVLYDPNGNIIRLFTMDLNFDAQNRLTEVKCRGEGSEQYGYNPSNLRIWKKTVSGEEEIHFYGSGGRRLATYRLTVDKAGNCEVSLKDFEIYFAGKLLCSNSKPVVLDRLGTIHA